MSGDVAMSAPDGLVQVELHNESATAVEAVRATVRMLGLGADLVSIDGCWFVPDGYVAFACERQGYVKRLVRGPMSTMEEAEKQRAAELAAEAAKPKRMSIADAIAKRIRFVRRFNWANADDRLELPLIGDNEVGPWATLHSPAMEHIADEMLAAGRTDSDRFRGMGRQDVLLLLMDCGEPVWDEYRPPEGR